MQPFKQQEGSDLTLDFLITEKGQSQTERLRQYRRRLSRQRRAQRERRGVLLLVVLSMLVLFLLIGTTFVLTTSSFRTGARVVEKKHQTSLQPWDRLERAMLTVLRDTNNPHSVVRFHSLLRDVYGSDGFVGHVYAGPLRNTGAAGDNNRYRAAAEQGFTGPAQLTIDYTSRYSGSTNVTDLGPSAGQFIDIYVQDDCGIFVNSDEEVGLPAEYVVDLELTPDGLTNNYRMARTAGYYNGCLLTILEGPARGQTARVVEHNVLTRLPGGTGPGGTDEFIHRLRVMAFTRQDGTPVQLSPTITTTPAEGVIQKNDLIVGEDIGGASGNLDENDLYRGVRFMVNGRPYNGLGVGHNQLAGVSDPKLNAMEVVPVAGGQNIGIETALTPNAVYFSDPNSVSYYDALATNDPQATTFGGDPAHPAVFRRLNVRPGLPPPDETRVPHLLYQNYVGPGGSDESYDAADFQNMFMALQPQVPRPQGRVANDTLGTIEIEAPQASTAINGDKTTNPRLNLDDVPIPSFHRPALVNFWFHRMYQAPWLQSAVSDDQDRVRAILRPYDANGNPQYGMSPAVAAQIVLLKRKISLRPLREDHPNFDGSNPSSRYASRANPEGGTFRLVNDKNTTSSPNLSHLLDDEITFPYWEATGPWDVDNDNDGVPDSIWVDLGEPVQELGDGRMYKPLYAFLIEDMDGRLNLNAHGSADHFAAPDLDRANNARVPLGTRGPNDNTIRIENYEDYSRTNPPTIGAIIGGNFPASYRGGVTNVAQLLHSTNQLPHGSGWGPGDITLRPVLSPEYPISLGTAVGDPLRDDYARLFVGRVVDPVTNPAAAIAGEISWGRYGSLEFTQSVGGTAADLSPGVSFDVNAVNPASSLDTLSQLEFADYPQVSRKAVERAIAASNTGTLDPQLTTRLTRILAARGTLRSEQPDSFGELPDLRGRYSNGLDYRGQPIVEAAVDQQLPTLVADAPYEVNLMTGSRRDLVDTSDGYNRFINDDAPFSPAELERVLRAMDPDAGRLPDRLWNVVDAFDPDKLLVQLTGNNPLQLPAGYNSGDVVSAQVEAAARRRAVTTESYEVPAPNENWTARLIYGADGRPGVAGQDDDDDWRGRLNDNDLPFLDEADEARQYVNLSPISEANDLAALFNAGNDDYYVVMGADPPKNARLLDYLRYRVTLELKRRGLIAANTFPAANRAAMFTNGGQARIAIMDDAERQINEIIYGNDSLDASLVRNAPASFGGLLAPEVIAGLKMDLNRPFGDGRDNNGNGVVDEELEAGEPWVDTDNNGTWNAGEPYLDLDGDGRFYQDFNDDGMISGNPAIDNDDDWADFDGDGIEEPVIDSLWQQQYGQPLSFDHVNGKDANGRGATTGGARVYDDGQMARQLYARHLYCLMLLNMDEGYVAPFDPKDPQVMHYLDPDSYTRTTELQPDGTRELNRSVAFEIFRALQAQDVRNGVTQTPERTAENKAEARRLALRKLTCRKVAQWAINCVDMRDPDAAMTPFEYDENPWDGWGVSDTKHGEVFPLDGDISTNENFTQLRTLTQIDRNNQAEAAVPHWRGPAARFYLDRARTGTLPGGRPLSQYARGHNGQAIPDPAYAYDQTRGVVWGTERPELLITEGLALHDRRVSNEPVGGLLPIGAEAKLDPETEKPENDLDQYFKPVGSAFIEIYNPWSADGAMPAEIYRDTFNRYRFAEMDRDVENDGPPVDNNRDGLTDDNNPNDRRSDIKVEGVILDRLSEGTAPVRDLRGRIKTDGGVPIVAPSPVWRMICVEQHPQVRNDDPLDNELELGNAIYNNFPIPPGITANFEFQGANGREVPRGYQNVAAENLAAEQIVANVLSETRTGLIAKLRKELETYRGSVPNPVRITNTDFPTFDSVTTPTVVRAGQRFQYDKPMEYIEREWYFTREATFEGKFEPGVTNQDLFDPSDVRLCIPDRPVRVKLTAGRTDPATRDLPEVNAPGIEWPGQNFPSDLQTQLWSEGIAREEVAGGINGDLLIYPRHFPPVERIDGGNTTPPVYRTIPLAPILPGQFGVIGSAGTEYAQLPGQYITRISRGVDENSDNLGTADTVMRGSRRIELVPNPNPYLHQVVVGRNFGDEFKVTAPTPVPGRGPDYLEYLVNATDPSQVPASAASPAQSIASQNAGGDRISNLKEFNDSPQMPAFYTHPTLANIQNYEIDPTDANDMRMYSIRPAVAIPIDNMNISKPVDNYILRRAEIDDQFTMKWEPDEYIGEGTYGVKGDAGDTTNYAFDQPFDLQIELILNHTTPNYRSVHLQRLANPLLAWNPPALKVDGTPHPQHDPQRPVNPYRTVDSMSLDITALNSINRDEEQLDPLASNPGGGVDAFGNPTTPADRTSAVKQVLGGLDPLSLHQQPHDRPGKSTVIGGGEGGDVKLNDTKKIIMTLGSQYRGLHELTLEYQDEVDVDPTIPGVQPANEPPEIVRTLQPSRVIWRQERPNQFIDVLDGRLDTSSVEESIGRHATYAGAPPIRPVGVTSLLKATGNQEEQAFDFAISHSLGFDNRAVVREYFWNREQHPDPGQKLNNVNREDRRYYKGKVDINGVFTSNYLRDAFSSNANDYCYRVDVNGDGILGDLVGAPQINESNFFQTDDPRTGDHPNDPTIPNSDKVIIDETQSPFSNDYRDNVTFPWLTWNDRPYLSANELLQVPASSSGTLTRDYSLTNPFTTDPPSRYDGFAVPLGDSNAVGSIVDQGATETNQARIGATNYPFGHLLNMFQASNSPAVALQVGEQAIPVGAPHFHRILDYVHTPSRFVGTDWLMNPLTFNSAAVNTSLTPLDDPRRAWQAPFNKVAEYREPGKINLNTIVGQRDPSEDADLWSDVYDGLMHRNQDGNAISYNDAGSTGDDVLEAIGHLGPAWRDVVVSRRGYAQHGYVVPAPDQQATQLLDYSPDRLNPLFPSRFANPFRSSDAGDLVPLPQMVMPDVDASLLRAHHFSPGPDGEWGFANVDDGIVNGNNSALAVRDNPNLNPDPNFLVDDAREAGSNQLVNVTLDTPLEPERARARDVLLMRSDEALPDSVRDAAADIKLPVMPLFSAGTSEASLDASRSAGLQYQPMTRLANLTSTRSGVFAVWITVGFFEVTPAPAWTVPDNAGQQLATRARFGDQRELYDRVYPEGYQLGQEIGSETGDVQRFKAFYLIDRTRPVAFKPGEDINSEQAILLRRRIE